VTGSIVVKPAETAPSSNERLPLPPPPKPSPVLLPPASAPAAEPNTSFKLLPPVTEKTEAKPVNVPPVSGKVDEPPARRSFADITARPEFDHATDYTSLTGELSYLPQKNQWRLRYTSIEDEDRYGGSVTLDAIAQMKGFHSGQLVRVRGEMIDKESRDISPLYRVKEIAPVK
jgi:hypothetical protein